MDQSRESSRDQDKDGPLGVQAAPGCKSTTKKYASVISFISFALGIAWILLFPLVTISTGESKPRGTFFDENSLLVHHTSVDVPSQDVAWASPAQLKASYPEVNEGLSSIDPS